MLDAKIYEPKENQETEQKPLTFGDVPLSYIFHALGGCPFYKISDTGAIDIGPGGGNRQQFHHDREIETIDGWLPKGRWTPYAEPEKPKRWAFLLRRDEEQDLELVAVDETTGELVANLSILPRGGTVYRVRNAKDAFLRRGYSFQGLRFDKDGAIKEAE
jgi:hypothetical protein